jgi:hypothetical protein
VALTLKVHIDKVIGAMVGRDKPPFTIGSPTEAPDRPVGPDSDFPFDITAAERNDADSGIYWIMDGQGNRATIR